MAIAESPDLDALLESLLFVAEGPVTLARLEDALGVDRAATEAAIGTLAERLSGRGIRLLTSAAGLQLVSAPEAGSYVERFLGLYRRLNPARANTP